MEDREFERGETRIYYEIQIQSGTVWVPVELSNSGLRRLAQKPDIAHCREILSSSGFMQDAACLLRVDFSVGGI